MHIDKISKIPAPVALFRCRCLLLLILLFGGACTTVPQKQTGPVEKTEAPEQEQEQVKIVKVEPVRPKIDLTEDLPDDAFLNRDIEQWLADDVVEHYDEHPIPA